jgi:hypothetical protein
MLSLEKHLDFVNAQRAFHEKRAASFLPESSRRRIHLATSEKFKALFDEIVNSLPILQAAQSKLRPKQLRLALSPADIRELPQELLNELSIAGDLIEFTVVELIETLGGVASLDQILVGLFRRTGEIHKRSAMVSRLYRMAQRGVIYSVPGRKGVYSIEPITEEEANRLLSPDSPPPEEMESGR